MRIKRKILFLSGMHFFKNELLKALTYLLHTSPLYLPPNLIDARMTLHCNLKCRQCPAWKTNHSELSTELWKKIILDIKSYIGSYFIRFYGGEPFCRNDFLELINFCSHNDIATLITTNGTLNDKSIAQRLAKEQLALINISLDGINPETHDALRGVQGTHQKVMQAIEYLQGKVPIQINTTIIDDNVDEILNLSEFAYKNKIQISFQGLVNLESDAGKFDFQTKAHYLFPKDRTKIDYIVDELCKRKKYNSAIVNSRTQLKQLQLYYTNSSRLQKKFCGAVRNNHLIIKEKGDVFICSLFKPVGNLTKMSIREIWRSEDTAKIMRAMNECEVKHCLVMRGYCNESIRDKIAKVKRCILNKL